MAESHADSNGTDDAAIDPLSAALAWRSEGAAVALAWVVETWGSAPRPPGSVLAIREDGRFEGSVSGGCIEGAVIAAAGQVLESRQPRLLEFGVSNAQAWEVGLSCGGRIKVYVEPVE
ncbi:MAG: XdhC family protein [Alphaproteobacteria bacterium]|nr:MAG: XdhC family protein [Alphaproteobacteria bacterium]